MPDIKLRDGSGVEQVYTGVDTITVPLADGSGTWTYGLTDEELVIEGDLNGFFDRIPAIVAKYGSRMTIKPTNYKTGLEDQSMLTLTLDAPCSFSQAFNNSKVTKLPKIIGSDKALTWCNEISINANYLKEDEALEFISNFDRIVSKANNSYSYYIGPVPFKGASFRNLDSVQLKWHQLINNEIKNEYFSSQKLYYSFGNSLGLYNLDELNNIAIIANRSLASPITSNTFGNLSGMYRVKNVTFATDNGTPYKVNWKNQTIEFSTSSHCTGWYYSGNYNNSYAYNSGINADSKNICDSDDSNATLEGSRARYQTLKDDPDNISVSSKTITYNGIPNVYLASLFSRYNHDSAVRTINSLPDASEYLTTAGGTNTIKFLGIAGALTDGGAINTLTEEEIAVAAAKGWTVTFV